MRARVLLAAITVGLILTASPAHATHHLWRFGQIFSNASGSVQFVQLQLETLEDNENLVTGFTVNSGTNIFTFPGPLTSSQTSVHKWILLGTANLASQPGGIAPDFPIPANFFPTGGGTLTYAGGTDAWTYGAVPVDGRNALHRSGGAVTTGVNTPTNFNLQTGSLNLTTSVPAASGPWIAVLVGALLLAASGLLRGRKSGQRGA